MRRQYNQIAYQNLSEAQTKYQEYSIFRHQIASLDNKIQSCNLSYFQNPSFNTIGELRMFTDQKFDSMQKQLMILEALKQNLCIAIQNSLMALQYSISNRDVINTMLDDSNVNSVFAFVAIVSAEKHIANSLKNYCQTSQISSIISEIDYWKSSVMYNLNGFENLRKFIFDYSTM